MNLQKLCLIVVTGGCLLLGASGAAMAVGCPLGFIIGERVAEIEINGQSCTIIDTEVAGDVTVTNSPDIEMYKVDVVGSVTVTEGDFATLVEVDSFRGSMVVSGYDKATVVECLVRGGDSAANDGNMTVNNNATAVVHNNIVVGDLTCAGNTELDSYFNRVYGTENCP